MGGHDQKWSWDSNFWMKEFSWFFACLYIFKKVKCFLNSYWVGMVKYSCGLLGHGTLISSESQEWIDDLSWFFACSYIIMEAKSYFNSYWVLMVKYVCVLLSLGLKNLFDLKNKLMNWADFWYVGSDVISFGETTKVMLSWFSV